MRGRDVQAEGWFSAVSIKYAEADATWSGQTGRVANHRNDATATSSCIVRHSDSARSVRSIFGTVNHPRSVRSMEDFKLRVIWYNLAVIFILTRTGCRALRFPLHRFLFLLQ